MMAEPSTGPNAERVVMAYNKIKAQRDAFTKLADEEIEKYDAKLDRLSNHLLGVLNRQGPQSFKAAGKTVYRHEEIIPNASDWNSIYRWIGTNQAWDMLERRIKKTFIVAYMEAHKGGLPPGVSVMRKFVAKIRANPKKKEQMTDD
jgi:hypothetical protein